MSDWRDRRALWIAAATALLTIAVAFGLAAHAAHRREKTIEHAAAQSAGLLGAAVALSLATLQLLLWWADAWRLSLAVMAIVSIGVLVLVGGTVLGWRQGSPLTRGQLRCGVVVPIVLLAGGAVTLVGVAAAAQRPDGSTLAAETMRLAAEARADAPMPTTASRLRRRADGLLDRALGAMALADDVAAQYARVADARASARNRGARARRSLAEWNERMDIARSDYEDYEQLLEPAPYEPLLPRDESPRDVPPPRSFVPPTTEDFGNGSGSVGTCADGTLSDSIGRPGACSHHGGVAP